MDVKHKYSLESDLLAMAGEEAIQRLGEIDNLLYFDFDKIECLASDNKNHERFAFKDVLKLINKIPEDKWDCEKKLIELPSGGFLTWANPNDVKDVVHITKDLITESKLKRMGKKVTFPDFLKYGTDALKQGLVDIELNSDFYILNSGKVDINNLSLEQISDILDFKPINN